MARARLAYALVLVALVGCSHANPAAVQTSTVLAGDASQVRAYTSLNDLSRDATSIVVAEATTDVKQVSSDSQGLSGQHDTVTVLRVTTTIKGPLATGTTFSLRQTGTRAGAPQAIVNTGTQYLLYLTRFEFSDHADTGQWSCIALDGTYQTDQKATTATEVPNVVHDDSALPSTITLSEAIAAAKP